MDEIKESVTSKILTSSSESELSPGRLIEGQYEIIEKIGEGGMGVVYKARQPSLGRFVAVKVLHSHLKSESATIRRFQKEARAVGALKHQNVSGVLHFGVLDGSPYLVMDYIDGQRLSDLIKTEQRLHWSQFKQIISQLCAGLSHAHNAGLVHRDLKPGNIMLEHERGTVCAKIVDFGIVKILREEEGAEPLTQTGEIFGTPLYMSPEQCQGHAMDHRSDIYALGCVMFEMLTGAPPFRGNSPISTVVKHLHDSVPSLARDDIPPHVQRVLQKALAKDPEMRFQSVDELAAALDNPGFALGGGEAHWAKLKLRESAFALPIAAIALVGIGVIVLAFQSLPVKQTTSDTAPPVAVHSVKVPTTQSLLKDAGDRMLQGEYPAALAACEAAIRLNPHCHEAMTKAGFALIQMKNPKKAIDYFDRALKVNPNLANALVGRAEARFRLKNAEGAAADLTSALQLDSTANIYALRGLARQRLGLHQEAIEDFTQVLIDNPNDPDALNNRAISEAARGDYAFGIGDLKTAIKLHPQSACFYTTRSAFYADLKKLDKAEADATKAISLDPLSSLAYNNRGYVYYLKGEPVKARQDFDQGLAINPEHAELHSSRGSLLSSQGDVKGAVLDFERALALDPDNKSAKIGIKFLKTHPAGGRPPECPDSVQPEYLWK